MALTKINVGTTANDGTGSTIRAAFQRTNAAMDAVDAIQTKIDTVESNADVTDAANVGTAIHSATEKTTPVDADTLPLIDSAASNALKKVTWANIKATIKTYFDTLYATVAQANATHTGDATGATALTLATVNSDVGSFGSATAAPAVTVNAKGLVTAVSTNTITPAVGSITGLGADVATALGVNVGTAGAPVVNGGALGTPSSGTLTSCTGLPTAGLVDDAVTLAKMAAGTAGNLITYDASGNPAAVATGTAGQKLTSNGTGAAPTFQNEALRISVFFSDQTTDWTTGTKVTFTWRFGATTLSTTPIDCTTAPTGSAAQFNVTKNGSTLYSTKPTIDAGETSTDTAATPAVLSTTSLANGDIVAIAIDQVGSTIKGKGGVITFIGTTLP